jgi:hypothetical protein
MKASLTKTASHGAIAALAGLLLGMGSAKAADLGGNCCADLEERVAELEATTVRKGNRRVSLTVSGQVNRSLLYWNDGFQHDIYSVDNAIANSRFRFTGNAVLTPNWSAGFYMEFDMSFGARSHQVSQIDDDGFNGSGGILGGAAFGDGVGAAGDSVLGFNQAYWYVESKQLGRVNVGRLTAATSGVSIVDLSNTGVIANSQPLAWGGGFAMRNGNGVMAATAVQPSGTGANAITLNWGQMCGGPTTATTTTTATGATLFPGAGQYAIECGNHALDRRDGVMYTSPTFWGFTFSGTWGERDYYDVAARYAAEWYGFRVAGGAGYRRITDVEPDIPFPSVGPIDSVADTDRREWLASGSVMHIATGLFASGAWLQYQYHGSATNEVFALDPNRNRPDTNLWWIDAGIQKNWTGWGATTFYGEFGQVFDGITGLVSLNIPGSTGNSGLAPLGAFGVVTDSDMTWWGGGVVQTIDAAAMDLYLGFRMYSADATMGSFVGPGGGTVKAVQIPGGFEDIWFIQGGARIQF